jgi:hypothetical protein
MLNSIQAGDLDRLSAALRDAVAPTASWPNPFDDETCRLEPLANPFGPKVLPMSPE